MNIISNNISGKIVNSSKKNFETFTFRILFY